jgi:hypothetical protein
VLLKMTTELQINEACNFVVCKDRVEEMLSV